MVSVATVVFSTVEDVDAVTDFFGAAAVSDLVLEVTWGIAADTVEVVVEADDVPPEIRPANLKSATSFEDDIGIFASAEVAFAGGVSAEEVGSLTITGFARDVWGSLCESAVSAVFTGGEAVTGFSATGTQVCVIPGGSVTLFTTVVDDEETPVGRCDFMAAGGSTDVADEIARSTFCTAPGAVEEEEVVVMGVGLRGAVVTVVVTVQAGPTAGGPVGVAVVFMMMEVIEAEVVIAGVGGSVAERDTFFTSVGTVGEQFVVVFESVTGTFVAEVATPDAAATTTMCGMVVTAVVVVDTGVDFSPVGVVVVFPFAEPPLTSDGTRAECVCLAAGMAVGAVVVKGPGAGTAVVVIGPVAGGGGGVAGGGGGVGLGGGSTAMAGGPTVPPLGGAGRGGGRPNAGVWGESVAGGVGFVGGVGLGGG